jgi:hypothetical protein
MRTARTLIVAVAAFCGIAGTALATHVPGAPGNDDYLQSAQLNAPGTPLERTATLKDNRDTRQASVQGDVFNPPQSGGPREVTDCKGTNYGRTVWYDFYPDVPGIVQIQANGYNSVIAVVPFNATTGVPDFAGRTCINDLPSTTEKLFAKVRKGRAYTVQVGGVNNVGGDLEFLFDFLADTDGDGVLDGTRSEPVDKCRRVKGPASNAGCPREVKASVKIKAKPTSNGIEIVSLTARVTRKAKVTVSCTRRACRRSKKTARRGRVRFRGLRGKRLPAGSKLIVRTTKKKYIGAYTAFRIVKGNFRQVDRCLNPGSKKPRRKCG